MFRRKVQTMRRLLREGGVTALYPRIIDNLIEKTVVLNGCSFSLRGINVEGLRNGLLNGDYEQFERDAVQDYVSPQLPVIELGGCLGVVGCITNRLLQRPEKHVIVEANPKVIPLMKANRKRNNCSFEILNRAIAYDTNSIEFSPAEDFASNSLREHSRGALVRVKTTGLSEIVVARGFERFTLICDIEGHEAELVEREPEVLCQADLIIMETHARLIGEDRNQAMVRRLEALGFEVVASEVFVLVLKNKRDDSSRRCV